MMTDLVWLYCPAVRDELFDKAMRSTADAVVFDLEDSVLPDKKRQGRELLGDYLSRVPPADGPRPRIIVRINGTDTPWFADDLAFVAEIDSVTGVRFPKVVRPDEISSALEALQGREIHVSVEDAAGLARLQDICAVDEISTVTLGEADLRSALRFEGEQALDCLRVQLVCALSAAGKRPPMGSVFMNVRDDAGLLEHTRHLRSLGFMGRTAIHPAQIDTIRRAFMPAPDEVERARAVVRAAEEADIELASGAFTMPNGEFVDIPVIRGAQETLALAEAITARLEKKT